MDDYKKKNIAQATAWDWNVNQYVRRTKCDTRKLHKLSRRELKNEVYQSIVRGLKGL